MPRLHPFENPRGRCPLPTDPRGQEPVSFSEETGSDLFALSPEAEAWLRNVQHRCDQATLILLLLALLWFATASVGASLP